MGILKNTLEPVPHSLIYNLETFSSRRTPLGMNGETEGTAGVQPWEKKRVSLEDPQTGMPLVNSSNQGDGRTAPCNRSEGRVK